MTATAGYCSTPLAWARRPRRDPAPRGGRFRAYAPAVSAAASSDAAFHPDVFRAADSLQAEFRAVDRALAVNSSRVAAAFRRARVAPHVTPPPRFIPIASSTALLLGLRASLCRCVRFSISAGRRDMVMTTAAAGRRWTPSSLKSSAPRPPLCAPRFHFGTRQSHFAPFVAYLCLTELLFEILIPPSVSSSSPARTPLPVRCLRF